MHLLQPKGMFNGPKRSAGALGWPVNSHRGWVHCRLWLDCGLFLNTVRSRTQSRMSRAEAESQSGFCHLRLASSF